MFPVHTETSYRLLERDILRCEIDKTLDKEMMPEHF